MSCMWDLGSGGREELQAARPAQGPWKPEAPVIDLIAQFSSPGSQRLSSIRALHSSASSTPHNGVQCVPVRPDIVLWLVSTPGMYQKPANTHVEAFGSVECLTLNIQTYLRCVSVAGHSMPLSFHHLMQSLALGLPLI